MAGTIETTLISPQFVSIWPSVSAPAPMQDPAYTDFIAYARRAGFGYLLSGGGGGGMGQNGQEGPPGQDGPPGPPGPPGPQLGMAWLGVVTGANIISGERRRMVQWQDQGSAGIDPPITDNINGTITLTKRGIYNVDFTMPYWSSDSTDRENIYHNMSRVDMPAMADNIVTFNTTIPETGGDFSRTFAATFTWSGILDPGAHMMTCFYNIPIIETGVQVVIRNPDGTAQRNSQYSMWRITLVADLTPPPPVSLIPNPVVHRRTVADRRRRHHVQLPY